MTYCMNSIPPISKRIASRGSIQTLAKIFSSGGMNIGLI